MTTDPTAPKPFYTSKSFWVGVVLTLLGISTYFSDPVHTPTLTLASISEAIGGIATIVLRVWYTNSAIAGTGAAAAAQEVKQSIAITSATSGQPQVPPA